MFQVSLVFLEGTNLTISIAGFAAYTESNGRIGLGALCNTMMCWRCRNLKWVEAHNVIDIVSRTAHRKGAAPYARVFITQSLYPTVRETRVYRRQDIRHRCTRRRTCTELDGIILNGHADSLGYMRR